MPQDAAQEANPEGGTFTTKACGAVAEVVVLYVQQPLLEGIELLFIHSNRYCWTEFTAVSDPVVLELHGKVLAQVVNGAPEEHVIVS